MTKRIARWESRSGKHWVDLLHDGTAATYTSPDAGGCLGVLTETEAITKMQAQVNTGYFQPDANKTAMRRVDVPQHVCSYEDSLNISVPYSDGPCDACAMSRFSATKLDK